MSTRTERRRDKAQAPAPAPNPSKSRTLIAAIVAVLAIIGIAGYAWWHSRSLPAAAVAPAEQATFPPLAAAGSKAPPLELKAPLDTITSASLAGKPYMLEIFATWCPHCQRMTSVLRKLRAQFPEDRLAMLSVTGSPYGKDSTADNMLPESQQDVDAFEREFNTTWPTIFDPNLTVAHTWGLDGFPSIYVVNGKGTIVYSGSGEVTQGVLAAAVRKAGG